MNFEYSFPAPDIRSIYDDLTIEPAGAKQGRIEDLGSIGGGQDDDAQLRREAVHLDEQGVEGLLALVVARDGACDAAGLADGVQLVDEDDRGCRLPGLPEQVAEGDASDPNNAFLDVQTDPPTETEKQFVPLDWDRRHQINATLTLGDLGNYALSTIARYGSGLPYTPTFQNVQSSFENSGRRPAQFTVDMYMYKNFRMWAAGFQVFLRVFNLFDRRNEVNVFTDTGRAGYSLAPLYVGGLRPAGLNTLDQYYIRPDYYSEPRRVQVGLEIQF